MSPVCHPHPDQGGGNAIVLLSGDLTSTVCLYWAISTFDWVEAVTFTYDQHSFSDLIAAKKAARFAGVNRHVLDISTFAAIGDTNRARRASGDCLVSGEPSAFPGSWFGRGVPARNAVFLTLGASFALASGADYLVTGTGLDQDNQQGFLADIERAIEDEAADFYKPVRICAPLTNGLEEDAYRLADELGVLDAVIANARVCCERGDRQQFPWGVGCDKCSSCFDRALGFDAFISRKAGSPWTLDKKEANHVHQHPAGTASSG